jgi:hypothetical protein
MRGANVLDPGTKLEVLRGKDGLIAVRWREASDPKQSYEAVVQLVEITTRKGANK